MRIVAIAICGALALASAATADEYDNEVGFTVTEPTYNEVWIAACKRAALPMFADGCDVGPVNGRYAATFLENVNAYIPSTREWLASARRQYVDRLNIAYREMRRRGIPPKEAIALCNDPSIVTAYVNARAGIVPTPNVRIEMK